MTQRQEEKEKISINLKEGLRNPGGPDDLTLKDGDQIFIPNNPGTVEVKGAVRKPAILQYKPGRKLDYYLELCGGFHKDADKTNTVAYLPNDVAYKKKKFLFFRISPTILPGSTIEVPFRGAAKEIEVVEVRGAVQKPTLVQYRKEERLDYYINFCGGYTQNTDLENIIIRLPNGSSIERKGALSFNPSILPGSMIEIPFRSEEERYKTNTVEIQGAVKKPGLIRYREGEKLDFYIDSCGGYAQNADLENIVIHLPDGKTIERKRAFLFNPVILPGSIIEVPIKW